MNKRILSSLLMALLLFAALCTDGSADFRAAYTYRDQFTDVPADAWYYPNVKALYELGLTVGQGSADRFAPDADMTLAEVLTMSARLRSLYETGSSEAGPQAFADSNRPWYHRYAAYLQSLGIIGREFEDRYLSSATRAQMAHILADTLPEDLFSSINGQAVAVGYASRSYITDVTEYTPYQQDILTLYRWGILSGVDASGSFQPDAAIRRSQVAAMMTRLAYSDLRITLDWAPTQELLPGSIALRDLVSSDGTFHTAPSASDSEAIDENIRSMLSKGERHIVLSYSPNSLEQSAVRQLLDAFLTGMGSYLEQTYNAVRCSASPQTGAVTLTFFSSLYEEEKVDSYRQAILESALSVRNELWSSGVITSSSSEYEKALAYYTWLCDHCRYDYGATESSISHSAYSLFSRQLAVCDGYTAAYNLLLKLEGIRCSTVLRGDHVWTSAVLDGTPCHIDPTWGDQAEAGIAYQYFAMTEAESLSRFP